LGRVQGAVSYDFKAGIGTSSRRVKLSGREIHVGTLVLANHGSRHQLCIRGVPVGKYITANPIKKHDTGSIVGIIATDAPLLPHQLKRLTRRAYLGLARTGAISSDRSGDFFIAFSTANKVDMEPSQTLTAQWIPNSWLDPVFEAILQAVEEAIINSLVAAKPMKGYNDHYVTAIPKKYVSEIFKTSNPKERH